MTSLTIGPLGDLTLPLILKTQVFSFAKTNIMSEYEKLDLYNFWVIDKTWVLKGGKSAQTGAEIGS